MEEHEQYEEYEDTGENSGEDEPMEELAIEEIDFGIFRKKEPTEKKEKLKHNTAINNFQEDNKESFKKTLLTISETNNFDKEKLTEKLNEIFNITEKLPDNGVNHFLKLQLKCFSYILSNNKLLEGNKKLKKICWEIDENCGKIPTKLNKVNLPKEDYLPPRLKSGDTKEKWAKILYDNPGRTKKNKVDFFSIKHEGHTVSSVRVDLIEDDINLENKEQALCYAVCSFFNLSNLEADHFQSSSDIISRQEEMIYLMSVNEEFRKNIINQKECKDGYFVINEEENVVCGTKLFFMEYHNCIDNLWLINKSANAGIHGKSDEDPIEWLKTQKIFEGCLEKIGEVNKNSILYTVGENDKILCLAVKKWYREEYDPNILISNVKLQVEKNDTEFFLKIASESDQKIKNKMNFHQLVKEKIFFNLTEKLKQKFDHDQNEFDDESSSYPGTNHEIEKLLDILLDKKRVDENLNEFYKNTVKLSKEFVKENENKKRRLSKKDSEDDEDDEDDDEENNSYGN